MGLLSKVIAMTTLDETRQDLMEDSIKLPRTQTLSETIDECFHEASCFHCCIFYFSHDEVNPDEMLESVESFGRLLPLERKTFLLLFPSSIDHKLLFYHLNKCFQLIIVEQFSADTPQKVLGCIQKYM
jgi:hypothetical protein